MKSNEATIFIFIASIIIGLLISMNISFSRKTSNVFLSAKQYQDAYNYKNKLHGDITSLIEEYRNLSTKLEKYKNDDKSQSQATNGIKEELNQNQFVLGKVPVEGPGIEMNINDADTSDVKNAEEYDFKLIHNTDMIQVINDLKNSGAEAISVNGQRVVEESEVYCSGPFLRINGIKIASPFSIYAIGNKDVLYNYMMSNENYLKVLITRKIKVNINQSDNIKVPAYLGEQRAKYMKNNP